MALAGLAKHEDELVCDFAQYYNVLHWRGLPLRLAATLACGLPGESRTMRAMSTTQLTTSETLLAATVDRLSMLVWMNSKDGQRNTNRPKSILSEIKNKDKTEKPLAFASAEAFEAARKSILEG